jgi:hypothetical protein
MGTAENYLRDVIPMLLERAREAKRQATSQSVAKADGQFLAGRREAYYEVIATLIGQLDAFGMPRSTFGVPNDFDPERELL